MKTLITVMLTLTIAVCSGCSQDIKQKKLDGGSAYEIGTVEIVTIDSCEYIKSLVSCGYTYCHKGNCKNHKH